MVKLKMKIPQLDLGLKNMYDSAINFFYEIRNTKKIGKELKCKVIYCTEDNNGYPYWGITDESGRFLFVPLLFRMYFNLKPIHINGIKHFFVSQKYHCTINFKGKLAEITDEIKYNIIMSFKYLRNIETIEIKGINPTLDLHLFDNEISEDLGHFSYQVTRTKAFEFMKEIPHRIFLLSLLAMGGIGFGFGMMVMSVIVLAIGIVWRLL